MTSRHFKFPTLAFALLAAFALSTAALWTFPNMVLEHVLRSRLAAQGIPLNTVEIESVSPWRLEARNLGLAGMAKLHRLEADIDWPGLLSPRLSRITITGLSLELRLTSSGIDWRSFAPGHKGQGGIAVIPDAAAIARMPEVQLRDSSAKILAGDGQIFAEVSGISGAFASTAESAGATNGARPGVAAKLSIRLMAASLSAGGWRLKDAALAAVGHATSADGALLYRSTDCDRLTVGDLRKEGFTVTGPLSFCVRKLGNGSGLSIDRNGKRSANLVAEIDAGNIAIGVGTLPPIKVSASNGLLAVRLMQQGNGRSAGDVALTGLDFTLPDHGISVEGIEYSTATAGAKSSSDTVSFVFGAAALRQLAPTPALSPLTIQGEGKIAPATQTMKFVLRQPASGLAARFHLRRNNESGESDLRFEIPPLTLAKDGPGIGHLSPLLKTYLETLTGTIEASGKIAFNDSWATPVQINGEAKGLTVKFDPSSFPRAAGGLTAGFDEARFKMSLPPASPGKGRASLELSGGSLQFGDHRLSGLTGDLGFDTLWPVSCQSRQNRPTGTPGPTPPLQIIVSCLEGAVSRGEIASTSNETSDLIAKLRNHLSNHRQK